MDFGKKVHIYSSKIIFIILLFSKKKFASANIIYNQSLCRINEFKMVIQGSMGKIQLRLQGCINETSEKCIRYQIYKDLQKGKFNRYI